jgi:predicted PurR-regulated permease PerM
MASKQENILPDYRVILLLVAVLGLIYLLSPILAPFLIAGILAYICSPLVDRLARVKIGNFRINRTLGTLLVSTLVIGVVILVFLIVVPLLQKELVTVAERLPKYFTTAKERLEPWLLHHFGVTLAIDSNQIQEMIAKHWKSAGNLLAPLLMAVSDHGLALIGWLANLLLIPLVLFYLLRDWHVLVGKIADLLPRRWYDKTAEIAQEIDRMLAEFLRGQLSVMLAMSVFYAVGLWMAGLELAIPIGLIAGLLGFVPYLGVGIGMLLAALAGALQFNSLTEMIPLVVVFSLGQILESFLLTPWLVGDRIGLHPVAVIFALLAGGQLFGFTGVLLALPVGAAIAVGLRHAKRQYQASDTYLK